MTDATYKDGPHVTNKNKDGELTNITYSKDTGNVKLQDSRLRQVDTYSNSGDSGYTDMHNEDSREAENDYYMIKEDRKSNTDEIVDDQYYTIKDNVSSDYNKIAFKPEVIPDDQNYGHTLRPGKKNVMDRTYDHAGSSGTLLHAPSREDVNEYSHLNERKPKINHKEMANAVFNQNQLTSKTNELGDVALTGHDYFVLEHSENEPPENSKEVASHDYFVLEKSQSQLNDQETTAGTDAESHDYFVLSKEESIGDTNGNNSVPKLRDCKADFKHDTRGETHNDVNDHTYFENPFLTELEDDIHQYQAMDQRISNIEPENTNHDYFILEKEKA